MNRVLVFPDVFILSYISMDLYQDVMHQISVSHLQPVPSMLYSQNNEKV